MIMNLRRRIILLLATPVTFLGAIGWHAHSQAQSSPTANLTLETAGLTLQEHQLKTARFQIEQSDRTLNLRYC